MVDLDLDNNEAKNNGGGIYSELEKSSSRYLEGNFNHTLRALADS